MPDPLRLLPGYLLRRASVATMGRLNERLATVDLRAIEASLIIIIGARPGITQSDAGRILGMQRANMAPMTAKLEQRGLLIKAQKSGRSQGLSLTDAGADLLKRVKALISDYEQELMDKVPADLRPHVVPVLRAIWSAAT